MGSRPDYIRKKYAPLQAKTLQNALAHRIGKEFPRIGGRRILGLCARMVMEVVADHLRPREHITHGQALWMAISIDDPPRYKQRIADVDMVPVVLDLSTPQDVQRRLDRVSARHRLREKAVRLCHQAYQQGGLLSNCDLAERLHTADSQLAAVLTEHERQTQKVVPRRATVHDVGSGLTHKRIICHKRYAEGKNPQQIARETYHSLESVDRYLGEYDRVRHCRLEGLTPGQTAHALDRSVSLVNQYLKIDTELDSRRVKNA